MIFGENYASIYDALYVEKDYKAEAKFVLAKLRQALGAGDLRVLDLGCGTGQHAMEFVRAGLHVTGIDASPSMLVAAEERRAQLPNELRGRLEYLPGDVRTLNLGRQFDAAVSLFSVLCYMVTDADFKSALSTARRHLRPGGSFLFDFWYGPAVVASPPRMRERDVVEGTKRIKRITRPQWERERDVVRINYEVEVVDSVTGHTTRDAEQHDVRYFFEDKLSKDLAEAGFAIVEFREWYTGGPLSQDSFGAYVVAEAV